MVWWGQPPTSTAAQFAKVVTPSTRRECTEGRLLPWDTGSQYSGWWAPSRFDTEELHTETPVVFIHGKGTDADDWGTHVESLSEHAHSYGDCWAITFRDPRSRHEDMAHQLDEFVGHVREFTGSDTVDIVAHSLGVTGARHWLYTRERFPWVDQFIGIAGANHGIPAFATMNFETFDEPRRSICRYLDPTNDNGIIRLNDNETPGDIDYYTIRGSFDHYFVGNLKSPRLEGAEQNIVFPLTHNGARIHPYSVRRIRKILAGRV